MKNINNFAITSFVALTIGLSQGYAGTAIAPDHDHSKSPARSPAQTFKSFSISDLKRGSLKDRIYTNNNIATLPYQSSKVAYHQSFVTELSNHRFEVDKGTGNLIPTLIEMNQLTYTMGRLENTKILSITAELSQQGWEIKPFAGFSGKDNRIDDIPGFVAYNRSLNQFAIVIRGSQTREDEINSADWEVNFDRELINTNHGKFHRGFYNRTNAMMDNITTTLGAYFDGMSDAERRSARIVVSGHSQGAALATLVAANLPERLKSSRFFGQTFDNLKVNAVSAYILSAPRVGDQVARDWIHSQIGKNNIVRQNVVGFILRDPVPYASPGKTLTSIINKIPVVGSDLGDKFGGGQGAASIGYLAADLSRDVLTRNIKSEDQALRTRIQYRFKINNAELGNLIDNNPSSFFKIFAPQQTKVTLSRLVVDNVVDILMTYLAPLHYGGKVNQPKDAAYFQSSMVAGYYTTQSTGLERLLTQGSVFKTKGFDGLMQRISLFFNI